MLNKVLRSTILLTKRKNYIGISSYDCKYCYFRWKYRTFAVVETYKQKEVQKTNHRLV